MKRRMVITRIYNPDDEEQYVDQAITLSYWIKKGEGKDFQRQEIELDTGDLLDPANTGPEFICENRGDLEAAAAAFRAQMGD